MSDGFGDAGERLRVPKLTPQDLQRRVQQLPADVRSDTRFGDTKLGAAEAQFRVRAKAAQVLQLHTTRA
jgi:hypothetical protein